MLWRMLQVKSKAFCEKSRDIIDETVCVCPFYTLHLLGTKTNSMKTLAEL